MYVLLPDRNTANDVIALCPQASIVHEEVTLTGYILYTNLDWIPQRDRLLITTPVSTGNEDDYVTFTCCDIPQLIVTVSSEGEFQFTVADQLDILISLTENISIEGAVAKETDYGYVFAIPLKIIPTAANSPWVAIGRQNLDETRDLLILNSNLRKLGFSERTGNLLKEPSENVCEKFYAYYNLRNPGQNIRKTVRNLCKIVQQALVLLAYLPLDFQPDGLMCEYTVSALDEFKSTLHKDGASRDSAKVLPSEVLKALITKIGLYRQRLTESGYPVFKDPFVRPDSMIRRIKKFQKNNGLHVTKVLDVATLDKLNRSTGKSKLVQQPVAAVSSTVNNLRSKVGEIAGFKYDYDGSDHESDESVNNSSPGKAQPDINQHLRLMLKDDGNESKNRGRRGNPNIQSENDDERKFSKRMIKGLKASTTKTFGIAHEIASRGKSMTEGVKSGMKSFIHGTQTSEEEQVAEGINDFNPPLTDESPIPPQNSFPLNEPVIPDDLPVDPLSPDSVSSSPYMDTLPKPRRGSLPIVLPSDTQRYSEYPYKITPTIPEYESEDDSDSESDNFIDSEQEEINSKITESMNTLTKSMNDLDELVKRTQLKSFELDKKLIDLNVLYDSQVERTQIVDQKIIEIKEKQSKYQALIDTMADENQKINYGVEMITEKMSEFQEVMNNFLTRLKKVVIKTSF